MKKKLFPKQLIIIYWVYNVEKAFTLEVGSTKHENNWYVITREKMIHAQLGKKIKIKISTSYCTVNSQICRQSNSEIKLTPSNS